MPKFKILVITPVRHIKGVAETLLTAGDVTFLDDPNEQEVIEKIGDYDAIFTNPNKSKVFIGEAVLSAAKSLKVICTASTGTNHIDKKATAGRGITILSLTEEREVINRISSTAELAFTLTLSSLRNVVACHENALNGEWDYTRYIGRQLNGLTIGVIGFGRLGNFYADYCRAFGSRVLVFDPYKKVTASGLTQIADLNELLAQSDVISLHVHVSEETTHMINADRLSRMKPDVLLVNTARGEIVSEPDLVEFLKANPAARVASDVLADEIRDRKNSPLFRYALLSKQVLLTQHIGGMTREAQEIAYGHAAKLLLAAMQKLND